MATPEEKEAAFLKLQAAAEVFEAALEEFGTVIPEAETTEARWAVEGMLDGFNEFV